MGFTVGTSGAKPPDQVSGQFGGVDVVAWPPGWCAPGPIRQSSGVGIGDHAALDVVAEDATSSGSDEPVSVDDLIQRFGGRQTGIEEGQDA